LAEPGQRTPVDPADAFDALMAKVRACTHCAAMLPHLPRPIVQASSEARILVIGQAPGARVHASGRPWDDPSGDRLRNWMGIARADFDDPNAVALVPMGFCYPGKGLSADLPPRPECAPLWHPQLLPALGAVRLTLLVGHHAQARYLEGFAPTMTQAVARWREAPANLLPLPHPSWRSSGWMKQNPWFEADLVPALRARIADALVRQQD
jgi:uracil-DNA glycosylase